MLASNGESGDPCGVPSAVAVLGRWTRLDRRSLADREQSPVHEPGDDDGTRERAEEVAGGAEEDELERAHRGGRVGRAWGTRPARREWRRGGRPCTPSGLRGGQVGVKRGVVRVYGMSYGCGMSRRLAKVRAEGDYHPVHAEDSDELTDPCASRASKTRPMSRRPCGLALRSRMATRSTWSATAGKPSNGPRPTPMASSS